MIKILFASHSGNMLGAEKAMLMLARSLDRRVFEPLVTVPAEGRLSQELAGTDVPVVVLRRNFAGIGWRTFKSLSIPDKLRALTETIYDTLRLIQLILREHVEIVHVNTILELPPAIAAKVTGSKVVWHLHESPASPILRPVARIIWLLSDCVVANSHATVQRMNWQDRLNVPGSKLRLVYYGIDFSEYSHSSQSSEIRNSLGIPPDIPVVGLVGHLTPRKGVDIFVRAMAAVRDLYPQSRFVLVGEFADELYRTTITELLDDLNLRDNVIFAGFRQDIPDVMSAFDILVVPSREEPFGWVVIEGMAARTPVIASRVGGIPEIIIHGETGTLVEPERPQELAQAISQLLSDPQLRESMCIKARERVEEMFNQAAYLQTMTDIYSSLTS